jgi:uncharacterized membrane protein YqjE
VRADGFAGNAWKYDQRGRLRRHPASESIKTRPRQSLPANEISFGWAFCETGFRLLILALLFVSVLICFGGFVIMSVVFLLYLMMLIVHWAWGWSALALAAGLLLVSIGIAVIFKFSIAKPFFPATLAEFQKDREWLKHLTKSSR